MEGHISCECNEIPCSTFLNTNGSKCHTFSLVTPLRDRYLFKLAITLPPCVILPLSSQCFSQSLHFVPLFLDPCSCSNSAVKSSPPFVPPFPSLLSPFIHYATHCLSHSVCPLPFSSTVLHSLNSW